MQSAALQLHELRKDKCGIYRVFGEWSLLELFGPFGANGSFLDLLVEIQGLPGFGSGKSADPSVTSLMTVNCPLLVRELLFMGLEGLGRRRGRSSPSRHLQTDDTCG